jgi:autotransporter adhesin
VALGQGSVADRADSVSIGSVGSERQITNVAAGTEDTDAVNLSQLNAVADDAAGAQATADLAQTSADVAQATADAAQATANAAQVSADAGQATADAALAAAAATSEYVQVNSDAAPAEASGEESVAIGGSAVASGDNSVAMGSNAAATGTNSIAIGNGAVATGSVAIGAGAAAANGGAAYGDNSTATGTDATAIGNGSSATFANSTAIGTGATATRDNQVAVGTSLSTYTFSGLASAASNAAQSGALRLVTTDMAGNLGTAELDIAMLQSLGGRVGSLEIGLNDAARRANGGTAAAMALGGTVMPPNTTFAVSFNLATYRGEQGFSGSAVARVTDRVWVSGGIAGSTVKGSTGARAGITFGW